MKKNTKTIASIFNFSVLFVTILYAVFVYLDITVFKISMNETEGMEGIGVALIFALSLYFNYLPLAIAGIFGIVNGSVGAKCARSGAAFPIGLLVASSIFKIIALVSCVIFLLMFFGTTELLVWAIPLVIVTIVLFASFVLDFTARKQVATAQAEMPAEPMDEAAAAND